MLGLPRTSPESLDALVLTRHSVRRDASDESDIAARRAKLDRLLRGA